ncbi:MAG: YeeE/YedE family protein [Pseudooceanicola sp.]
MQPDWIAGLIGGLIIGLAGAVYLLGNGRIMGASGIVGGLVDGSGLSNAAERLFFIGGLFGAPLVFSIFAGFRDTHVTSNLGAIVVAGLLVGIGTRIANGCTSGHGVCGISRFSFRGMVATVFYILAGGLSVVIFKHVLGVI